MPAILRAWPNELCFLLGMKGPREAVRRHMFDKFEHLKTDVIVSSGPHGSRLEKSIDALWDEVNSEIETLRTEAQKSEMKVTVLQTEVKRLKRQIAKLNKMKFGPQSDRTPKTDEENDGVNPKAKRPKTDDEDQNSAVEQDDRKSSTPDNKPKIPRNTNGRGKRFWPDHLERREILMAPENASCPCGCGGSIRDYDTCETLEVIPARYFVAVRKYPKYRCRHKDRFIGTKFAPRVLPKTTMSHDLLANAMVMRYQWQLPWYRQENIFRSQGIEINRSTLLRWSNRVATEALLPIFELMRKDLKENSARLFMDETTIPKLASGEGKARTSQMFALLRDDRSFAGNLPPLVIYETSDTRAQWKIHELLNGYSGIVQTDAYAGYGKFGKLGTPVENVIPVKCWAHARRNFTDEYQFNKTLDAKEIVDFIAELYAEEAKIRGKPPIIRQLHRQEFSRPVLDRLRQRLIEVSPNHLGKNKMGQAIRYLLTRWEDFMRFVDDGRIDLDSNAVERMFKPTILSRKNSLFIGSDEGGEAWAILSSIIETCKLNGINAEPYLKWVLDQIANKLPRARYSELLPWNAPRRFWFKK